MDYAKEYDRMVEQSNRQQEENAALKEQVAQLEDINSAAVASYEEAVVDSNKYLDQLATLQSRSAALVDALETYFKQYPHMMKGYIADALAAFKGEK